ncbi:MAG: hypothetical protein ACR2PT_17570 [Endozoicomonas sp.]
MAFEQALNTTDPDSSEIRPNIIGVGSTSMGFQIPELEELLIRRLPGFYDYTSAKQHVLKIRRYRDRLHRLGIATTDTQLIALESTRFYGVVYVIQPFLKDEQLSKAAFEKKGLHLQKQFLNKQIKVAEKLIRHNTEHSEEAITIDIVSNNWEIYPPGSENFEIRLNDLAQPLYKENNQLAYDLYDQALSVIAPLHLIVQSKMQEEFEELFAPRNLLMQALWGYGKPISNEVEKKPVKREYPQWAMAKVNSTLKERKLTPLTSEEVLKGYHSDQFAIACLHKYRHLTTYIRSALTLLGLTRNLYMSPGNTPIEMYSTDSRPGYLECLWDAIGY